MTILDMLTKDKNLKSIFVTGHSLGGALANLCAIDMDFYYNNGDGKTIVPEGIEFNLVTFGSPRVGDVEFAFYVNNMPKMKRNIRVIYEDDIVAQIPVTNKFVHTGTAIRIKNELLVAEEFNFDETLRLEIAEDIFNPEGLSSYAANLINLIDCSISSLNAMTMISSSYDKIKSFAYDAVKLASISLYSNEKNEVKSKLNLMGQYHSAYKSKINTSQMKNIRKLYDDILAKRNSKKIKRRHNK